MTDAQGRVAWQGRYAAWGNLALESYPLEAPDPNGLGLQLLPQNLRLQGQYADSESGLHYNTFRYYDPDVGRFITPDPIGLAGGMNLYRFAGNAFSWIDPWGWMPFWKDLKSDGMGHHPIPRGHANDHGLPELGTTHDSPSWFPNEESGSDVLHKDAHAALKEKGVPFNRKFEGTQKQLISKTKSAYSGFKQKGYLKIPSTGNIITKNITLKQAVSKQMAWVKKVRKAGSGCP